MRRNRANEYGLWVEVMSWYSDRERFNEYDPPYCRKCERNVSYEICKRCEERHKQDEKEMKHDTSA